MCEHCNDTTTNGGDGSDCVHWPVSRKSMRPASEKERCFYCQEPIGGNHKEDCVLVKKKVKVRMTVEYEVEVPNHWDAHRVEFHRNDGSWCASNAIDELQEMVDNGDCLCNRTEFEYLSDVGKPFLSED